MKNTLNLAQGLLIINFIFLPTLHAHEDADSVNIEANDKSVAAKENVPSPGGLDLNSWCRAHHGEAFSAVLDNRGSDGWGCKPASGSPFFGLHIKKVCQWKHGPDSRPYNTAISNGVSKVADPMGWYCARDAKMMDLHRYCREAYGNAYSAALNPEDAHGWGCKTAQNSKLYGIDYNSVCHSQYGLQYFEVFEKPNDPNSGACVKY